MPRVHGGEERAEVLRGAHHPGQAQERARRVVRVDGHQHPGLLRSRDDRPEEVGDVGAELVGAHIRVGRDGLLEGLHGVRAHHAPREARHDRLREPRALVLRHRLKAGLGAGLLVLVVLLLRPGALEDEELECRELVHVKGERAATVRPLALQVRARPIDDRHEVVTDGLNAASADVGHRLGVVGEELGALGLFAEFDGLVHRDGLHDGPGEALGLHLALACLDRIHGPDLARGDVVEGRHDPRGARLAHVVEGHGVLGAVPAPALLEAFVLAGGHGSIT
mmetsp:Transcript_21768/g.73221  ORF Transcript_21768/g.73221 Transcript_21768/m.73221 type:complete len:280 (-) Transcript_21768:49-888(-)